jgi:polar amino acid transport system substrate-binding protein
MIGSIAARLAGVVLALAAMVASAQADQLDDIKAKGVLVVGTKADYPPFGFRDASGGVIGIEPDLGAEIAKRLGVKLEIVPVVSSNRMQFLQQGKIDLMIATMSDTPDRRKVVGFIEPLYYASGVAILANKKANIKTAADLKGKPVCAIQGAFYNNDLQSKYTGQDLIAFKAVAEAQQALLDGRCVGFVYDDAVLFWQKNSDEKRWADFECLQLNEWPIVPWGIAVKLEEREGAWGKLVTETVTDWLKSGKLLEIEKKWVGSNSKWLVDASAKAKQ